MTLFRQSFVGADDGGVTYLFDGTGSVSLSYPIITWKWTISDGTTYTTPIITHVFTAGLTYYITLTIYNAVGMIDTDTQSLTVGEATDGVLYPSTALFPSSILFSTAP
jgi:hypothetical protein